jgi:hypothetical protein
MSKWRHLTHSSVETSNAESLRICYEQLPMEDGQLCSSVKPASEKQHCWTWRSNELLSWDTKFYGQVVQRRNGTCPSLACIS